MKISTLNKIEKWFWIIWRPIAIILGIVLLIFLVFEISEHKTIVITKTIMEQPVYCDLGNLQIGDEVLIKGKKMIINVYTYYKYSSLGDRFHFEANEEKY